jgi:hypothetical protein
LPSGKNANVDTLLGRSLISNGFGATLSSQLRYAIRFLMDSHL